MTQNLAVFHKEGEFHCSDCEQDKSGKHWSMKFGGSGYEICMDCVTAKWEKVAKVYFLRNGNAKEISIEKARELMKSKVYDLEIATEKLVNGTQLDFNSFSLVRA